MTHRLQPGSRSASLSHGYSNTAERALPLESRESESTSKYPQSSLVKTRIEFATFVFAIYLFPPVLVLAGVIPSRDRFALLSVVTIIAALYVWIRDDGLSALGFRTDTLRASVRYNLGIILAALVVIAALFFTGVLPLDSRPPWRWFLLFYLLVSCPAQEFLFRSVLFAEMGRAGFTRHSWQVGLSSILYCFPHVIYRSVITLCVVLVIGIAWSYGFSRHRNFWGVALSHCMLGAVSIISGLI